MFPLRMTHPEHGATHVYDSTEQARHEALGWKPEHAPAAVVEAVQAPTKRKYVRKATA